MQRFRLLGWYVGGVVAVIGLAVWGVSLRRAAHGASPSAAEAAHGARALVGAGAGANVSIHDFVFDPQELVIPAGATVTWVNADDDPHTVTSSARPLLFGSGTLHAQGRFSFEFKTPGTYDYFCKAHPYMIGKVVVK